MEAYPDSKEGLYSPRTCGRVASISLFYTFESLCTKPRSFFFIEGKDDNIKTEDIMKTYFGKGDGFMSSWRTEVWVLVSRRGKERHYWVTHRLKKGIPSMFTASNVQKFIRVKRDAYLQPPETQFMYKGNVHPLLWKNRTSIGLCTRIGVIPWTRIGEQIYLLLGRTVDNRWCDFGGGNRASNPIVALRREMREEGSSFFRDYVTEKILWVADCLCQISIYDGRKGVHLLLLPYLDILEIPKTRRTFEVRSSSLVSMDNVRNLERRDIHPPLLNSLRSIEV